MNIDMINMPYHPRLVKYRSKCIALGHCIMMLELHARSALRNMHVECCTLTGSLHVVM